MSEQVDALRQAALALIPAAPAGAILAAMRGLLADWESERPDATAAAPLQGARRPDPALTPAVPPTGSTAPTRRMASLQAMAAAQDAERESWERLRTEVRERRNERGMTVAQLAEELGASPATIKTSLGMRRPPSARLRERLTEWLKTPEVVPVEQPFRRKTGNGAAREHATTGNGADTRDATDHAAI